MHAFPTTKIHMYIQRIKIDNMSILQIKHIHFLTMRGIFNAFKCFFLNVTFILILHIKLNLLNISEISLNKILPGKLISLFHFALLAHNILLNIILSFKVIYMLYLTPLYLYKLIIKLYVLCAI